MDNSYPEIKKGLFICSNQIGRNKRSASQIIASNYSPTIKHIKLSSLPAVKKKSKKTIVDKSKKVQQEILKPDGLPPGLCYLKDLLNRKPVVKKKRTRRIIPKPPVIKKFEDYSNRSAPLPEWPEYQLLRQREIYKNKTNAKVNEKDAIRITYYLTHGIDKRNIEPFPKHFIKNANKKVGKTLLKNKRHQGLIQDLTNEILNDYELASKRIILDYVLMDINERKRLNIMSIPIEYPKFVIRGPIPWHTHYLIGKQYCRHNLFTTHIIMRKLNQVWEENKLLFIPINRIDENIQYPLTSVQLEQQIDKLCDEAKNILLKQWLPMCADVIMDMRDKWQELAPSRKGESVARVERFFGSICSLMSRHLRLLVFQSLRHFLTYFEKYKNGNNFGNEFIDFKLVKAPLVVIKVSASIGTDDIQFSPTLEELTNLIYKCFIKIIQVNQRIPRLESIMFPDLKDSGLCLCAVDQNEKDVKEIIDTALEYFKTNLFGPISYLNVYDKFRFILSGEANNKLQEYITSSPLPTLAELSEKIYEYERMNVEICFLRKNIPLNFISLDCCEINDLLSQEVIKLRTFIIDRQISISHGHNRQICNEFDEMSNRASELPNDTASLVALTKYLTHCQEIKMYELRKMIRISANNLLFLVSHSIFPAEHIQLNARVFLWPRDMESVFEISTARLSHKREIVEGILRDKKSQFEINLIQHEKQLHDIQKKDPPMLTMDEMKDSVTAVKSLSETLKIDKEEAEAINEEESLLNWLPTPFTELYNMLVTIEPFHKLWNTVLQFHVSYDKWYYGPFVDLIAAEVQKEAEEMLSVLIIVAQQLQKVPGSKRVAELVKVKLEQFRALLPLLHCICNPGLCERHWQQMSEIIGFPLDPKENSTLGQMVSLGLMNFISQFEEISSCASKEFALEQKLKAMMAEWKDIVFECVPYRESGVCTLAAVDEIQLMLDDHILKAQTMHSSPYVKAFENEMQKWEDKLISMQDILDTWLLCQATWLYLEPIFSSEDIMRQMPREGQKFTRVDKSWREIMENTVKDPHVLASTDMPDMLKILKECNTLLEEIQKGLNEYLEKKRLFFPRFFFLSNDELLEILSETKDPQRVQPQLKKCFEGINKLDFNSEHEIVGIVSSLEEIVPLSGKIVPADAKGMVERWLSQLEDLMVRSVRDMCREAVAAYQRQPRVKWVLQWPGQAVSCANSIHWTTEVSTAVRNNDLKNYLEKSEKQLGEIVELMGTLISASTRNTLENLILSDIHAIDVVRNLIKNEVTILQDFNWLGHMRQYWREDSVIISMVSTDVSYGFEYLGNTSRLVITPLTDRCFRTIMAALKLNLGAMIEGPTGCGKSETCKDLAKAVAKQCIIFNCSKDLDFRSMAKFFKGLSQSGAWACFDEFDLISPQVLSVVAQQIFTIRAAIRNNQQKFIFENTEISLNPTCAILATLSKSHTGNRRLPENLKSLFRPVAMIGPDYGLISEIFLYSIGFIHAKSLGQKIKLTFELCNGIISNQPHYDFSLRSIKCLLNTCHKLKLINSQCNSFEDEAKIILRAIIDNNISKFISKDKELFEGILNDCFPGIILKPADKKQLTEAIKNEMKNKGLQCTQWYLNKIIQLYEIIQVQHGVMIIGSSLGGKTCAYQVLANALSEMKSNKSESSANKVIYKVINPKGITSGQLYGCFDPVTYEWSDGILANTFREYASSSTSDRKWIIFDGPIDSTWVENLNTTLDDNKKLCLMSGEIIKLSNKMTLIFETSELKNASPNIVSRCGVVYLDSKELGWRTLSEAFINGPLREKILMDEQLELIKELINWLIEPILHYVITLPTYLHTSDMHKFRCFSKLFLCLLGKDTQFPSLWLQGTLIFSIIWGLASTLTGEGKKLFDLFMRGILNGENKLYPRPKVFKLTPQQLIPEKGLIYDWVHDKKNNGTWITWLDTYDKNQPYTLVPVPELAQQHFFLRICLHQSNPILFVGPHGSGKTSVTLDFIQALAKEKFLPNIINFSAKTSANHTQDMIMSRLDRRRKGVFGPPMGKQCVLFVDDVSLPKNEGITLSQPAVELLRQWLDHGHWYDKDTSRLELVDILFLAAMTSETGQIMTTRFIRHMHPIVVDYISDISLEKIFSTQLNDWHFTKGFNANVTRLGKAIVLASLNLYKKIINHFLPTPKHSHYLFCVRDLSRLFNGLMSIPSTHLVESDKFLRLWVHECYRIFHDRLSDDENRKEFLDMLRQTTGKYLNKPIDHILRRLLNEGEKKIEEDHIEKMIFGSFMEPDANSRIYDEIADSKALLTKMHFYLREHNSTSKCQLPLVLFDYAVQHICRIARVLHLPQSGHALLVGVAGSGRRSVAKLAATMSGNSLFEIEITKDYTFKDWRNDLKILLKRAGAENKQIMFLMQDTQFINDLFLEDLNLIICSGDIPTLFTIEEKADIFEKMQTVARDMGKKIETAPLALYSYFVERIKVNLHIVLAVSPIGKNFRDRLYKYPALLSGCTINWFATWPEKGLESVAEHFLSQMNLEDDVKLKCIEVCKYFHTSAAKIAIKFKESRKRYNYITPASFLELIHTFDILYKSKTETIIAYKNRYITGLKKLDFASTQVGVMQEQLKTLRPQLIETSEETDKLMIKIEQDTVEVEAKKEIVGSDESKANEAAAAAQAIKDDCEGDLAEAIPALESALNALNTLKPADITVVKAMKNPPPGVKLVMEAICVMKAIKPDRKPDPSGSGKMLEDFWGPSLKLLGDIKFLDSLKTYSKDNIPPPIMKRIRDRYIHDREFHPESVRKSSTACEGLCKWVRAIEVYDRVIKIVAPKKSKLAEAEAELAIQMGTLNEKRAQLQQVTDKLQTLNDDFAAMSKKKKDLEDNIELCSQKLERAEKLIGGLGGEKDRWNEIASQLGNKLSNVTGDILLASGIVTYLGAFDTDFRQDCIEMWQEKCIELEIPCTHPFSLLNCLGDPLEMRKWNIAGLPADQFSFESGIIVKNCTRWPLMIDPQGQASKWIKNLEKENGIIVTKMTNRDYILHVEKAIKTGTPLLIENVGEELDPVLDPILLKRTYKDINGIEHIKFGDYTVEYNNKFRLYLTTNLSNPNYLPETAVKVTLLNFMLRPSGLEEQLLALVVAREKPHLEDSKGELILEGARNKQQLQDIEDKILEVLSSSEGNILEDETGIQILSTSKQLSEEISFKQEVSSKKEVEIDIERYKYMPVARYASVLFFCVAELSILQPTYQYSLYWYINLYLQAIDTGEDSDNMDQRIQNLKNSITKTIYENICRSLFENDKMVFSFLLWIAILRSEGKLDEDLWFFMLGKYTKIEQTIPNPDPTWINKKSWDEILIASSFPKLTNLPNDIINNINEWKELVMNKTPQKLKLPKPYENLSGLEWIIILKSLRPDRFIHAAHELISKQLGSNYVEPPTFDLKKSFKVSKSNIPLILVLFPGTDPTDMLLKFAEENTETTPSIISLGQGQGALAEKTIIEGACNGNWVILQNCHLFENWMPELERICDNIVTPEKTHKNFRLWLITSPSNTLPVSILEKGVKMTTETPNDFKLKLQHCYKINTDINREEIYKLIFSISLFHTVTLGRKLYGSLGWNALYEYNDNDYLISIQQIQSFIEEYKYNPYDGLIYMISECFYGGRVTDINDRNLLKSLLSIYCTKNITEIEGYSIAEYFKIPKFDLMDKHISLLKLEDPTKLYGLNENASVFKGLRDTKLMHRNLTLVQPLSITNVITMEEKVFSFKQIEELMFNVPIPFDIKSIEVNYSPNKDPKNIILIQELVIYNDLLVTIHSCLKQLSMALMGECVMTEKSEIILNSLNKNQIPIIWKQKSYPNLYELDTFVQDLIKRINFFKTWTKGGTPSKLWISAFYQPNKILNVIKQNYARKYKISIENITVHYRILKENEDVTLSDTNIIIYGLYLEGAKWNYKEQVIEQSERHSLYNIMPDILIEANLKDDSNKSEENKYLCPVYMTSTRENCVMHIPVPILSSQTSILWINYGLACLCQI